MSLTLYSLTDELVSIRDQMSREDYDPQTIADTIESLALPFEEKCGKTAMVALEFEAGGDSIDALIKSLQAKRDRYYSRHDALKEYLLDNMKRSGVTKIEHPAMPSIRFYPERDVSVEIFEPGLVPCEYYSYKPAPPPTPNKVEIMKALKGGEDVQGARLVKRDRIEVKA